MTKMKQRKKFKINIKDKEIKIKNRFIYMIKAKFYLKNKNKIINKLC